MSIARKHTRSARISFDFVSSALAAVARAMRAVGFAIFLSRRRTEMRAKRAWLGTRRRAAAKKEKEPEEHPSARPSSRKKKRECSCPLLS